jgi:hypothetical protein
MSPFQATDEFKTRYMNIIRCPSSTRWIKMIRYRMQTFCKQQTNKLNKQIIKIHIHAIIARGKMSATHFGACSLATHDVSSEELAKIS